MDKRLTGAKVYKLVMDSCVWEPYIIMKLKDQTVSTSIALWASEGTGR